MNTSHTAALAHAPAPLTGHGGLRAAIGLALLSLAGFGFLYSVAAVGLGQVLFPDAANGSLVMRGGQVVGSALVGQPFTGEGDFHPRPSAAGYDTLALSGSNQARTHPELRRRVDTLRAEVARREGVAPEAVPSDLVTQSGSGIDPHLSPAAAELQVARVARVRGLTVEAVRQLVAQSSEGRQFGLFGEPRVDVLRLNLALSAVAGAPALR